MRKYYWYLTGYTKKHGLVILFSLIAAILVFSFFIPTVIKSFERKKRVYLGVVNTYNSYELDSLPPSVAKLISLGLTKIEADDSVSPSLAERWTVENDGCTYRFVIRQHIRWQDGKQLTPEDLQYQFRNVEVVTTPNDIIFKLPESFVPFPQVVANPVLRYASQPYLFFFKKRFPVGVGTYHVVDYKEQQDHLKEIVLDSQEERRIYRFYFTEDQAVQAFKRGEVDVLPDLTTKYDIFDWKTVEVTRELVTNRYLAVFFNHSNPLFQENVRKALSYALPKPTDETRAIGPINPKSWAYLSSARGYDYDEGRALERIFDNPPAAPLKFTLTTIAAFQTDAESIKAAWEKFGEVAMQACQTKTDIKDKSICQNLKISINIHVTNFPDTSNFETLLIGEQIPPDPDQYTLWHSGQTTNFTNYKNTRIDSLLEKGRTTANLNERKAIYQEFQQFFLEDAPAVFIRYLESYTVRRK